ncbi:hypothetical protein K0M31_013358 [Melipona bicolor]|uniref:Uncharacterized protein n=1 Tax=Melipona bicolor TaxID=60889 RepID=A0AA40FIB7_9HYME|nr:hypothetical protein K0M31_013358 [Melipona bicolor]
MSLTRKFSASVVVALRRACAALVRRTSASRSQDSHRIASIQLTKSIGEMQSTDRRGYYVSLEWPLSNAYASNQVCNSETVLLLGQRRTSAEPKMARDASLW